MFRGQSVKAPGKDGELKRLKKKHKKLEQQYGMLLENCKPNPAVWESLVDYIDSKLLSKLSNRISPFLSKYFLHQEPIPSIPNIN